MRRILVIRLSALGDVVLSFGPFAAIRAHHRDDHVTVLTTRPFAGLLAASPWFDAVEVDARPRWWDMPGLMRLRRQLSGFDLVYDLQTSGRTARYFGLAGRPRWSGIARGAALPHANPDRDGMHTLDRQREQLAMAGISEFPPPDLGWLKGEIAAFGLPDRFAMLIPGAAPHRPEKRWPAAAYGELARRLVAGGTVPVVIGAAAEAPLAAAIRRLEPATIDLTGRTRIEDVAAIAARAAMAVGNDTGPMHLAAAMGAPCVVLFGGASDPALTSPRGDVRILRVADLRALPPDRVAAALP